MCSTKNPCAEKSVDMKLLFGKFSCPETRQTRPRKSRMQSHGKGMSALRCANSYTELMVNTIFVANPDIILLSKLNIQIILN